MLGYGRQPEVADIAAAVRLSRDVSIALMAALTLVGVARLIAATGRRGTRPGNAGTS